MGRLGKPLPLLDAQCCGSSPHLLRQTGAGSSEVLHVRLGAALSFIQDEVCGHFALQTGDVAVAEVVTQVVHLWKQIHICQSLHHLLNQRCNLSLTAFFFSQRIPGENETENVSRHPPFLTPRDESEEPVWPGSSVGWSVDY